MQTEEGIEMEENGEERLCCRCRREEDSQSTAQRRPHARHPLPGKSIRCKRKPMTLAAAPLGAMQEAIRSTLPHSALRGSLLSPPWQISRLTRRASMCTQCVAYSAQLTHVRAAIKLQQCCKNSVCNRAAGAGAAVVTACSRCSPHRLASSAAPTSACTSLERYPNHNCMSIKARNASCGWLSLTKSPLAAPTPRAA
jgi:hypothetical protein